MRSCAANRICSAAWPRRTSRLGGERGVDPRLDAGAARRRRCHRQMGQSTSVHRLDSKDTELAADLPGEAVGDLEHRHPRSEPSTATSTRRGGASRGGRTGTGAGCAARPHRPCHPPAAEPSACAASGRRPRGRRAPAPRIGRSRCPGGRRRASTSSGASGRAEAGRTAPSARAARRPAQSRCRRAAWRASQTRTRAGLDASSSAVQTACRPASDSSVAATIFERCMPSSSVEKRLARGG